MRLFLYNYDVEENWPVMREKRVLGIPNDGTGLASKAEDLVPGDVVVIHDTTFKDDFRVHGACVIAGQLIRQLAPQDKSPWDNLLWCDEKKQKKVIYPFRFQIDVEHAPRVTKTRFPWIDLDRVPAIGKHGHRILGKNAWSKKWRGNLLIDQHEVAAMSEVLGLVW